MLPIGSPGELAPGESGSDPHPWPAIRSTTQKCTLPESWNGPKGAIRRGLSGRSGQCIAPSMRIKALTLPSRRGATTIRNRRSARGIVANTTSLHKKKGKNGHHLRPNNTPGTPSVRQTHLQMRSTGPSRAWPLHLQDQDRCRKDEARVPGRSVYPLE